MLSLMPDHPDRRAVRPLVFVVCRSGRMVWDLNNVTNLDKTVFARNAPTLRTPPGQQSLARSQLQMNGEPRNRAPNRPLGHSTLTTRETVIDDIDQRGLASFEAPGDHVDGARIEFNDSAAPIVAVDDILRICIFMAALPG